MKLISPEDRAQIVATAHAAADAARVVTLEHFRQPDLGADNKLAGGFDPVTVADRGAEIAMREIITRMRPQDAILGEEFGHSEGSSGLTWVLDPIDGTRGYISGTPTWGVLIGLCDESGPVFGLVDQPYIRERFTGGFGESRIEGPLGQGQLATRSARGLSEATILSTFPEVGSEAEGRAFHQLASRTRLTRYGMDCYGYMLLAAGQVDLVVEAGLHTYDIMAPIAVIEAAGGIVTDWRGGPAHEGGRVLAAAGPEIHAEALDILRHCG
jgi:histidinol phosphatase-like enzyme (inositol monophosphatase family)